MEIAEFGDWHDDRFMDDMILVSVPRIFIGGAKQLVSTKKAAISTGAGTCWLELTFLTAVLHV